MAYDRIECDYHLTPDGWVHGDLRSMFDTGNKANPVPINRLLTFTHKTYHASNSFPRERSVRVTWRGDATDDQIAKLRTKYPSPFDIVYE
jgi:hypothetical protein